MKRIILSLLLAVITITAFALGGSIAVTVVSSVPVSGLTSIDYEFTGITDRTYDVSVEVNFDEAGYQPIPKADLSGDISGVSGNGTAFSGNIMWEGAASFSNLHHKLTRIKIMAMPVFPCGENVNFIYRGLEVTYGTISKIYNEGELDEYTLCWMDRNLGATQVATSSTDEDAYGDLFQWGRPADGHQVRDPLGGTTVVLSPTDVPPNGNFIIAPDMPRDWRVGQNNNLWQGVNGINNPCPTGWRVPTETEWAAERASWGFNLNSTTEAINSSLKLPAVGFRDFGDGVLINSGTHGYYWSSTVAVNDPRSMYLFISPNVGSSMSTGYRASGLSVRCVKD